MNMNFKGPRYTYPSIEVILELADQPERLVEHQERSPRYILAPAVFYVPGVGGQLSPVIQFTNHVQSNRPRVEMQLIVPRLRPVQWDRVFTSDGEETGSVESDEPEDPIQPTNIPSVLESLPEDFGFLPDEEEPPVTPSQASSQASSQILPGEASESSHGTEGKVEGSS